MNTDLSHLPEAHRSDLARLVELVRSEVADAEMVILFGSFARGDWKSEKDLPPPDERRSGHPSDYDILVITRGTESGSGPDSGIGAGSESESSAESRESPVRWDQLSKRTRKAGLQAHARFIGYDIECFNERLTEGRYFYTDIVKEGIMLHDSGNVKLAEVKEISAERRAALGREYFEEGMARVDDFHSGFKYAMTEDRLKYAAFNLHQAAETAYKTILLVFTHYSPTSTSSRRSAMRRQSTCRRWWASFR